MSDCSTGHSFEIDWVSSRQSVVGLGSVAAFLVVAAAAAAEEEAPFAGFLGFAALRFERLRPPPGVLGSVEACCFLAPLVEGLADGCFLGATF